MLNFYDFIQVFIFTTNHHLNVMGKKNNQTLVFNADREIPTLGSTDNAGNSINLVSGIIRLPSVGISLPASGTDDKILFVCQCPIPMTSFYPYNRRHIDV